MCGRFTLIVPDFETLARALGVDHAPDDQSWAERAAAYRPRFNVAPTDPHWIVRIKEERRELVPARWGLVNSWSKDPSGAFKQINARAETARTRPAFREAFEKRRCVVPADGFFEWVGPKTGRRPIWFHAPPAREGEPPGLLLLAGLYESWRDPGRDAWMRTFTILTTAANDVVAVAHDRMPAMLAPEEVGEWLHGADASLLRPAPHDALVPTFVSPRVNSVKNDDAACLEEVAAPAPEAPSLTGKRTAARSSDRAASRRAGAPAPRASAAPADDGPLFAPRGPVRPPR